MDLRWEVIGKVTLKCGSNGDKSGVVYACMPWSWRHMHHTAEFFNAKFFIFSITDTLHGRMHERVIT